MSTFILIHGSWHGAWNWHLVTPILERNGHQVLAIDLPGMGRDKTPLPNVKMASTVAGICQIMEKIEGKIILVAHSKNGIMISQVAEFLPKKIAALIYVAAYLLPNGQTQRAYSALDTEGLLKPYVTVQAETNTTTLQPAIFKEGLYHDCPDYITDLAKLLLSKEPIESAITPLSITETNFGSVPKYYIECTEDRAVTPFLQRKMYTETACNRVYSLASSHSPFFSMPTQLSAIFCEIASTNKPI